MCHIGKDGKETHQTGKGKTMAKTKDTSGGQVLDEYIPGKPGVKATYPWPTWFDGETRRLFQGTKKQFTCTIDSMVDLVRKTARLWCKECSATVSRETDGERCPVCQHKYGVAVSVFKEEKAIVIRPNK